MVRLLFANLLICYLLYKGGWEVVKDCAICSLRGYQSVFVGRVEGLAFEAKIYE